MKAKKRFFSLLLAICLVVGLLPTTALAVGNGKALQAGAIEKNDTVYYGMEQRAWQGLSADGNGGTNGDGANAVSDNAAKTIYFDAALSKLTYSAADGTNGKGDYGIPNSNGTIRYYATGDGKPDIEGNMELVPTYSSGTNTYSDVYKADLPEGYTKIAFSSFDMTSITNYGGHGESTVELTIPADLSNPCFYADTSDDIIYDGGKRDGYWDEVYTVRNPEQEGDDSNTVVDIPVEKEVRDPGKLYLSTTFYDFYTDYELNGWNRDNNTYDANNHRIYQPFRQFDQALSEFYKANNVTSPLYWGNFQNYPGSPFSQISADLNLYGSDDATKFFYENNSMWGRDGYEINLADKSGQNATIGLVSDTLSDGNLMIKTSQGTVQAPFLNKDFLSGNNSKNAVLGKVYENVAFPFLKESLRSKSDPDVPGQVDYWVFDSKDASTNLRLTQDPDTKNYYLNSTGNVVKGKTTDGVTADGNFFPFNGTEQSGHAGKLNYGFATKLETKFRLTEDGTVVTTEGDEAPIEFNFSGDDDVWIFIDGKLALDIGGVHDVVTGCLNFKDLTYYVSKIKNPEDSGGYINDYKGSFTISGSKTNEHTLTMFYMERGMWESDMYVSFNFPTVYASDTKKIQEVELTVEPPEPGQELAGTANATATGIAETSQNPSVAWKKGGSSVSGNAEYNTVYTAEVTLTAASGYAFADDMAVKVNDSSDGVDFTVQADGTLKVSIAFAAENATPQASFIATGDNGGTLSNVDTSMKYSTDGGANWKDITGTTMEITGVTAENDVKVYQPGNGSTTSDSAVQTIYITQADKPTVSSSDCTTSEQDDGKITGVNSTMEYKLSTVSEWTGITGTEVTELSNGTYDVRVKASGTALASAAATVTIGAHTCVAQGAWQYDANEHWKLCACDAKVDTAAHSGGTATCTAQAVCTECSQPYGSVDLSNHTGTVVWVQTETTHKQVYNCCQTEVSAEEKHNWQDGKCTVCDYPCAHTGGTATCSQLAVCDICGSQYGALNPDNHKAVSAWTQENGKHYHKCEYGCDTHLDEANCSGGEATCTAPAVCETCGNSYGSVNPDNHTGEIVWTKTATAHSSKYSCCDTPIVTEEAHDWTNGVCSECGYECQHNGGTATCSQLAVCDICGSQYGDYDADNHKAVSAWTQENGKHYHKCEYGCDTHLDEADCSGGEAICTALAVCETCGNSYGAINPDNHTGEIVWTKTATDHSSAYGCCNAPVVTEEAHEWQNGVCSECGYECQHDGGTATCADKAVCNTCGEEYGGINASNHTNLVKTEAKAATHMTEGNIEYWYCDGCDKYFSDEAGTKEIALKDTVIPKLTEHTADGTGWHSDETNHWNTCECGEKLNEAAHTFEWVTDKEATATEAGSKHEKCTVCGYEKAAVEIPATGTAEDPSEPPADTDKPSGDQTGDTTSPQTGDDSNIALWIAVLLAAGAALTGTAVYSRKRKYSE